MPTWKHSVAKNVLCEIWRSVYIHWMARRWLALFKPSHQHLRGPYDTVHSALQARRQATMLRTLNQAPNVME